MTNADFRPKKRSGVVPSGKPRRKIPVLRILLLIAVAFFTYLKFDSIWSGVRALNPVAVWDKTFGGPHAAPDSLARPAWSPDSSTFTLECPYGLRGCCESAPASATGICRQAEALLNKARVRQVLGPVAPDAPLRLHARAGVSRTGHGIFNLAALQGRATAGKSSGGSFALRKNSAGIWCDTRQVCLTATGPKAPLALGRLQTGGRWVSASSAVHPVLPGRITAVDSVPGGVRIRIYHGGELYTSYEPLRLTAGAKAAPLTPGSRVGPQTVLGDAPWLSAGYTVLVRARRAGLNVTPSDFFAVQPLAVAGEDDSASATLEGQE